MVAIDQARQAGLHSAGMCRFHRLSSPLWPPVSRRLFLACMDSAFGESDALGRRVPDRPRPSTSFSLTASIGCPAPAVSTFKSEQNAYPWSLSDSSLICCSGRKPTTVACPTDFRGDTEPFMRWLEVVRVSAGRSALTDAREVRPCELYPSRQCWWGSCWRR